MSFPTTLARRNPGLSTAYRSSKPSTSTSNSLAQASNRFRDSVSAWYNAPTGQGATFGGQISNPAQATPTGSRYGNAQAAQTAPRPQQNVFGTSGGNPGGVTQGARSSFTPASTTTPTGSPTGQSTTPTTAPWSMGGTEYSPNDLQTMLNNPYVFAQEWLKGRGMDTPTMLARLGDFPEAAAPLIFMLLGDQPVSSTINANTSASMLRRLLYGQTEPGGGGIDAKAMINKLLSYGADDSQKDLLGASLGSGTPNEQVQFLNDLLNVSTINASPYFANPLRQSLSYLGNSFLGSQLDANKGKESYSEWLRKNGLFGVV